MPACLKELLVFYVFVFLLSVNSRRLNTGDAGEIVGDDRAIVPSIPSGVSGTALASSLLRDGWTVSCVLVYVFL